MVGIPEVLRPDHDWAAAVPAGPFGEAGRKRAAEPRVVESRAERDPRRGEAEHHDDRRGAVRMATKNGLSRCSFGAPERTTIAARSRLRVPFRRGRIVELRRARDSEGAKPFEGGRTSRSM